MNTLEEVLSFNALKQKQTFCFKYIDPLIIYCDYSLTIVSDAKSITTFSLTYNFICDIVEDLNSTVVVARYYLQRFRRWMPLDFANRSTVVIVMSFF